MRTHCTLASRWSARLRVAMLLLGIACASFAAFTFRAQARVREAMASAGEKMLTYSRAQHLDGTRTLMLNGVALRLLSGSTRDDVDTLLDFMQANCRATGGKFEEQLQAANRGRTRANPHDTNVPIDGVLRDSDARRGYVACLDLGGKRLPPETLLKRVQAFLTTGDLAEVGALRMVWAKREGQLTSYLAMYAEGPMPLWSMFPSHGDAPGIDLPDLPRPLQSERLLSAWQQDEAPMLVSYRVAQPLRSAELTYRALLERSGFRVQKRTSGPMQPRAVIAERSGALALAVFAENGPASSLISLTPIR